MYDYTSLEEIIYSSFSKYREEYENLGIYESSIISRLQERKPLSVFEINLIKNIFGISDEKICNIFFTHKV